MQGNLAYSYGILRPSPGPSGTGALGLGRSPGNGGRLCRTVLGTSTADPIGDPIVDAQRRMDVTMVDQELLCYLAQCLRKFKTSKCG